MYCFALSCFSFINVSGGMILDKFNKLHINNTRKVLLILNHNFSTKKSEKIKLFWENEIVHKANLTYDLLTNEEKQIHNLHEEAVSKGHFTYHDPKTNERILTRLRHYLRGKCCGNACRHVSKKLITFTFSNKALVASYAVAADL